MTELNENRGRAGGSIKSLWTADEAKLVKHFLNTFQIRQWDFPYTYVDRSDPEGEWILNVPRATNAAEQFTVVQTDTTHVRVYAGYWHHITTKRVGDSAPYTFCPYTESTIATDGGDIKFDTAITTLSDSLAITETSKLWLKLDWTAATAVLTGHAGATPASDPDFDDEKIFWLPFAEITFASGAITQIDQLHSGSIVTTDYGHPVLCEVT